MSRSYLRALTGRCQLTRRSLALAASGALLALAHAGHAAPAAPAAPATPAAPTAPGRAAPAGPEIVLTDVTRFYQVYEAAGGHPTVEQIDHDYLAAGTQGLHEFARARNVTAA